MSNPANVHLSLILMLMLSLNSKFLRGFTFTSDFIVVFVEKELLILRYETWKAKEQ